MKSLPDSFQRLPSNYFFDPYADTIAYDLDASEEVRIRSHIEWGSKPYQISPHRAEERTLVTSRGEHMHSKAEVLIAEKLYEYGIPFRYEQPLELPNEFLCPDFTFEGKDGSEFYLEFCGMMDNGSYVERHKKKMQVYEVAGIVP